MQVAVYDGIQTFGRQMRDGLSNLPTNFVETRDAFGQQFNGCVLDQRHDAGRVPERRAAIGADLALARADWMRWCR
jgi:hypothetical protein